MEFKKETKLYSYEVQREEGEDVIYFNYKGADFSPSLAENSDVMERAVDALTESPNASRIVFVQEKNYNYDLQETNYLLEIAHLYTFLLKQEKVLAKEKLVTTCESLFPKRYNEIFTFLLLLKRDPISSYAELRKLIIENKIALEKTEEKICYKNYISLLEKISDLLKNTKLINVAIPYLKKYQRGDREIYYKIFKEDIIPSFTFTRLISDIEDDAEIVDQYKISGEYDESVVTILRKRDEAKLIYHLNPPENSLDEQQSILLNLAKNVLSEHEPKAEEFTDTERIRQVFFNVSRDLVQDLANSKNIKLSYNDLNKLAIILVRSTIGFGLIEILLQDKKLQDIVLNAPISMTNIFVRHEDYDECSTNILPSQEDADSWAAKFRVISGRPLDEANPILDTQLMIGNLSSRVAIIQKPLSPLGLAYAIRRHRENPWTLPLFVKNKMLNPFAAGLLSFLVDGSRTLLIAGTRSSGKTSLLGALMQEIIPRYRIIVIEDTLELPVDSLMNLKYDILRMKVRSSLLKTSNEIAADEGIRTSLRLGDSCLIVGEVRSVEAKALYEAMRVGALANVVAGTIHGASPYAIFDRVVNDLEVPITSFKATDIIAVANPIKTPDGLHSSKRLVQISEVRKHWTKDPLEEKGFVDLMKYNVKNDELEITDDLKNGESEIIKDIASNVKGWAGNWDAIWDNIQLRAQIKQEIVNSAEKSRMPQLLESEFNVLSNNAFHNISGQVREEVGLPVSERVFPEWQKWLNQEIKKRKI